MEFRARAVRMVMEVRPDYETEWAAIAAIAAKLWGWLVGTVRKWVLRLRSTGSAAGHDESGPRLTSPTAATRVILAKDGL